jgi:hypothetical protein
MVAGGVGKFEDAAAVAINLATFAAYHLSVALCIVVDGTLGVACDDQFGGLGEVELELGRPHGGRLRVGKAEHYQHK